MPELLPLDQAAVRIGKSEVTLRRLIRAGRVPFQKEKTHTGFIYLVDPEKVQAYYQMREGGVFSESSTTAEDPYKEYVEGDAGTPTNSGVRRVAVAGENQHLYEYWLKKSELYEDKFNAEVLNHAQTREQLGMWRGRAEQAQAMLMKFLPSPEETKGLESKNKVKSAKSEEVSWTVVSVIVGLVVLVVVAGAAVLFMRYGLKN